MCASISFRRWLAALLIVLLPNVSDSIAQGEDPLVRAKHAKRAVAIDILEDAVAQDANRIDCWVELVRALDNDRQNLVADLVSRAALAKHPQSLAIWQARLALCKSKEARRELLPPLEQIIGDEEHKRDIQEMVEIGVPIPYTWDDSEFRGYWATHLVEHQRWERAQIVVDRSLRLLPREALLWTCQARLHAQRGDYVAMLKAQKLGHYSQRCGLADYLLTKREGGWAIKSFGDDLDGESLPERSREALVLTHAHLANDDLEHAQRVIKKHPSVEAELLWMADLLRRERRAEATAIGKQMIERWIAEDEQAEQSLFTRGPFPLRIEAWPTSVAETLAAMADWFRNEFPAETKRIDIRLHTAANYRYVAAAEKVQTLSQLTAQFEKDIAAASPENQWRLRWLNVQKVRSGFDAGATLKACQSQLSHPLPKEFSRSLISGSDWCLAQRRVDAMTYFGEHPEMISVARRTIARWKRPDVTVDEEPLIAPFRAIGPGGLALVHDALRTNTITTEDRTPQLLVIQAIGSEVDTPSLVRLLNLRLKNNSPGAANDTLINQVLEKLTNTKSVGQTREERVKFWLDWWDANSQRVVREVNSSPR